MAHLLVIESWVGSVSRLLPKGAADRGHPLLARDLAPCLRPTADEGPHPLLAAEAAATAAVTAVQALGLDQPVAPTEPGLTAHGPRITEVGPRPAGNRITEPVRRVTGGDLATACAGLAPGLAPNPTPHPTDSATAFLLPDRDGVLRTVEGAETVRRDPSVVELTPAEAGRPVRRAADTNARLGHVVAVCPPGRDARSRAGQLLARLTPRHRDRAAVPA